MRILFVSDYPHLPDVIGGLQTTTHDLCLAIQTMGAETAVLCGTHEHRPSQDTPARYGADLGYLVIREPSPASALPLVCATWQPDVVVVQSGTALAPMVRAALACDVPCAVYLHNVETHQLAGVLPAHPSLLYLANSSFTARRWHALFGLECVVVPPVIAAAGYFGESQGADVLFVNPAPIKGVELMFQLAAACPELPFRVHESWTLDPTWRAWCLQRADRLDNIAWHGPVRDMRQAYGESRVLLMPSIWEESFGRTVIEAQLGGLPVLASNRGALPEVVGAGGMVLDPHAPIHVWAAALRKTYVAPASLVAAARENALGHVAATPLVVGELMAQLAAHASR
jgi:glycosyltransferase involved in cell wall biosynthesis